MALFREHEYHQNDSMYSGQDHFFDARAASIDTPDANIYHGALKVSDEVTNGTGTRWDTDMSLHFRPRLIVHAPHDPHTTTLNINMLDIEAGISPAEGPLMMLNQILATNTPLADSGYVSIANEGPTPNPLDWYNTHIFAAPRIERDWRRVKANLQRMDLLRRSPFVPRTLEEYVSHLTAMQEAAWFKELQKQKQEAIASFYRQDSGNLAEGVSLFGGRLFSADRSAVLSTQTMWADGYIAETFQRETARWPCKDEMEEEGDQRYTSNYGRFPALPREPGYDSQHWRLKKLLKPLPFDEVWPKPTLEMIAARKVTENPEEAEQGEELLGEGLMAALDCDDEI